MRQCLLINVQLYFTFTHYKQLYSVLSCEPCIPNNPLADVQSKGLSLSPQYTNIYSVMPYCSLNFQQFWNRYSFNFARRC